MRTLKLQTTLTIDGFGIQPSGETQESFTWDEEINDFCVDNLHDVDAIVLGRNTADEFIPYWMDVAENPAHELYKLGKPLTDIPKVVFSNRPPADGWYNTTVANGDLSTAVQRLKNESGKSMLTYGGYSFVSSLIEKDLIDDYYLLMHPVMIGRGETIFNNLTHARKLKLQQYRVFPSGTVLLHYTKPVR